MRAILVALTLAVLSVTTSAASACILELRPRQGDIVKGVFIGCTMETYQSVLREFLEDFKSVELLQVAAFATGSAASSYFEIVLRDPQKVLQKVP